MKVGINFVVSSLVSGVVALTGCNLEPATATASGEGADKVDEVSSALQLGTQVHKLPMRMPGALMAAAAPAGSHLNYYGGRVVSNIQVVQVLYGSGSYLPQVAGTSTPSVATFFNGLVTSSYMDWFSEYNTNLTSQTTRTNQTIGRGTFVSTVSITPSSANNGSTISDAAIQSELAAQITAGKLPAPTKDAAGNNNTYYAIFFPPGKTISQGTSNSCAAGGFCAYHGTVANVPGFGEVYYGVHPDMQAGSGCATGCGNSTTFNNYTSVASHELIETLTDPEVGLATTYGPPLAWYDQTNGEIGDICNASQGTIVGSDGVTYTVQQEFDNATNSCITTKNTGGGGGTGGGAGGGTGGAGGGTGGGTGGAGGGTAGDPVLAIGGSVTAISGTSGSQKFWQITVPAGTASLTISITGSTSSTSDADLYTRAGSHPTTTAYDCRPYKTGSNETCTYTAPAAGTYYVMLRGYSAYSGVTLSAK